VISALSQVRLRSTMPRATPGRRSMSAGCRTAWRVGFNPDRFLDDVEVVPPILRRIGAESQKVGWACNPCRVAVRRAAPVFLVDSCFSGLSRARLRYTRTIKALPQLYQSEGPAAHTGTQTCRTTRNCCYGPD